uniref:Vitellogenin domain-containing protein n=1 Tax=Macrostomum lignano TaxID=282301 RepID=A0A1I8J4H2_9PLAT
MPSSRGGGISLLGLPLLLLLAAAAVKPAESVFSFKEGKQYVYDVETHTKTKDIGDLFVTGQFSIQLQGKEPDGSQHLALTLTKLHARNGRGQTAGQGSDVKLDGWFSFHLDPAGRVSHVRYPHDETAFLATVKKAMVTALLGHDDEYKFHNTHEWSTKNRTIGRYHTEISKTRRGTMHYNHVTRLPDRTFIHDEIHFFNDQPEGFDSGVKVRKGPRVVMDREHEDPTSVSRVTTTAKSEFTLSEVRDASPIKQRPAKLASENINQTRLHEVFQSDYDLRDVRRGIDSNLTCIATDTAESKSDAIDCYHNLVQILQGLSQRELNEIASMYLDRPYGNITKDLEKKRFLAMLDAVCSVGSVASDLIINKLVLKSRSRHPELVQRVLVFLATRKNAPANALVNTLVTFVFNPEGQPDINDPDTYHRCVLALGTVCRLMQSYGNQQQKAMAQSIVSQLEKLTEVFDPYHHRSKRDVMDDATFERFIFLKSSLIDSLGNAAFESSFEVIQSYSNESSAPTLWKRSGLHSMRKFETIEAASTILTAALTDSDEHVRYEASLMYEAHPSKTKDIVTMHREFVEGIDNGTLLMSHNISKRSVQGVLEKMWKGIHVKLAAPGVNWQKMIGSTKIGGSFGMTALNELIVKLALIEGQLTVNVHDEVFARGHLGVIGIHIDFFLARVCFRGGVEYKISILKEFGVNSVQDLVKLYDRTIGALYKGVKDAINGFRKLFEPSNPNQVFSITKNLRKEFRRLPYVVSDLAKSIVQAVDILAEVDPLELPSHVRPLFAVLKKMATLANDIKADVTGFYYTLHDAIENQIPMSAKQTKEGLDLLVKIFPRIFRSPKEAIMNAFKSFFQIGMGVNGFLDAKNRTLEACFFLKEEKPYWWNLTDHYRNLKAEFAEALRHMERGRRAVLALEGSQQNGTRPFSAMSDSETMKLVGLLKDVQDLLMEPLSGFRGAFGPLENQIQGILQIIRGFKEAYQGAKESWKRIRSIAEAIMGPRAHSEFQRTYRLAGKGCKSDGFYPSDADKLWNHPGVDLAVEPGEKVVVPFKGEYYRGPEGSNQLVIVPKGFSMEKFHFILENVKFEMDDGRFEASDLPVFDMEQGNSQPTEGLELSAGDKLGVTGSTPKCENHIHLSARAGPGRYLDSSKYLEPRVMKMPKWEQKCDDYKLVILGNVIAEGAIVGLKGRKDEDTSPEREATEESVEPLETDEVDLFSNVEADSVRLPRSSILGNVGKAVTSILDFPKKLGVDKIFDRFSLRRLRLAYVVAFLEAPAIQNHFEKTREKMDKLLLTIKDVLEDQPCQSPYLMSEEELRNELVKKGFGKSEVEVMPKASLIDRMKQSDSRCPLLQLSLPRPVYCQFDKSCLSVECCIDLKVKVFRKAAKLWARLDPCGSSKKLEFGLKMKHVKTVVYTIDFNRFFPEDFEEKEIWLPDALQFLKVLKMKLRLSYQFAKSEEALMFSLRLSACSSSSSCEVDIQVLQELVLPLPICKDGLVTWPKMNWQQMLNKNHLKSLLQKTSTNKTVLVQLAELHFRKCRNGPLQLELPQLPGALRSRVFCQVSPNCTKFECCMGLEASIRGFEIAKYLKGWAKMDACTLTFSFGFNSLTFNKVLFAIPYGKEFLQNVGALKLKYRFNENPTSNEAPLFSLELAICPGSSSCLLDYISVLNRVPVPVPFCGNDWHRILPGNTDKLEDFLRELGTSASQAALDKAAEILLTRTGLNRIISKGRCARQSNFTACPHVRLPQLPSNLQCRVADNCMGLECCLDFAFKTSKLDLSFLNYHAKAWILLDTCEYTSSIGIGALHFNTSLLEAHWGQKKSQWIGNKAVRLDYSVDRVGKDYVKLDFDLSVCFAEGDCDFTVKLLKDTVVPQPFCHRNFTGALPGGSLGDFAKLLGNEASEAALQTAFEAVVRRFGLQKAFFNPPECALPSNTFNNGWDSRCPRVFHLPRLPSQVRCHLNEFCMGVTCCAELDFKVFKPTALMWLILDPCEYRFSIGFNNLHYNQTLFYYEWGQVETFNIGSPLQIIYSIRKDSDRRLFLVDLKLSLTIDSFRTDFVLLENSMVPQVGCNMNASISLPGGGQVKDFIRHLAETGVQKITDEAVQAVLRHLGIGDLIDFESKCENRTGFFNHVGKRAIQICPGHLLRPLIRLPHAELLRGAQPAHRSKAFALAVSVDPCDYKLLIRFEKMTLSKSLFRYDWGRRESFDLGKVIFVSFKIDRDPVKKLYFVDLELQVKIEGDTLTPVAFLNNFAIPIPICNPNASISLPGGSIGDFVKELGGSITESAIGAVLRHLRLEGIIATHSNCSPESPKVCPGLTLPDFIPDPLKCYLNEHCMGIECCMSLDFKIKQISVKAWAYVDPCDYKFSIGLENWKFERALFSFDWGEWKTERLGNPLVLRYRIAKDSSRRVFTFDLTISLKVEDINQESVVLHGYEIPQLVCNREASIGIADLINLGSSIGGNIKDTAMGITLQRIGLDKKFFRMQNCSVEGSEWQSSSRQQSNCPLFKLSDHLNGDKNLKCRIKDNCLEVECCLSLQLGNFRYSYNAWAKFDPCQLSVGVGIENWNWTRSLFDKWGLMHTETIGKAIDLSFKFDRTDRNELVVSFGVGTQLDGLSLLPTAWLIDSAPLPIPYCRSDNTLSWPKFDPQDMAKSIFDAGTKIILNRVGITANILRGTACSPVDMNIWPPKSDCPNTISMPSLPPSMNCTLTAGCMGVECCAMADFKLLKRAFHLWLKIDPCSYDFSVGFEKVHFNTSLLSFDWGVKHTERIGSSLKLEFVLNKPKDLTNIVLSMKVSICSGTDCDISVQLFENYTLPVPYCNGNGSLSWPQVDWQSGLSGILATRLAVPPNFLRSSECPVAEMVPSGRCPYFRLPDLPDRSIACRPTAECTGFQCCATLDLRIVRRAFEFWFRVDPCTFTVDFGFENWHRNTSFIVFPWGTEQNVQIEKAVRLRYTLSKTPDLMNFVISGAVQFRLDGDWLPEMRLLTATEVPIPGCAPNGTLFWPSKETIGHQISGLLVNRLGVSPKFLRQLQCSRNSLAPIESCPYFDKPQLPSQADCQLHHLCMGLVCCLDLDLGFVSRSFSAWAFVDPCQHIVSFGFENWAFNRSILNYPWGEQRVEHIGDSLLVKYKLDHKPDDSALFLDAAFDLCLDGNCLATPITLLNEARLPVPLCSGSGNLSWPEFNSSDIRDHMVDKAREMLMQRLGLEKDFLKQGDCALPPGSSSLANPRCPNFRLTRDLPDSVQCQLSDDCLELRCCVKLKLITLEKSFSASLRLDPCAMTFSAQFENWAITRPVFTDFSKWLKILIGKALSIDIQFNRHHDGQLELAWHVANCAGHASCNDEVLPLLSDARVPIPHCLSNGSLEWPKLNPEGGIENPIDAATGVLMNRLELDRQLLKQPQCRPELYAKKWPPHCTFADVTLRLNREPYNCKIHDQCLGIECCTELDFKVYSRHFFYTQLVDPCTYSFYIGFENFFYNQSLFHFDWGQDKLLKIAGSTVELRYNLTRTPDLLNLIVTARLAICKEGYCELANTNFLNHYLMPIPRCYSNGSLSWTVERDQVSHTIKGISGLVLTRLNLERGVISDDSCRLGDVEIQRSFSACPHTIIPSLPAGMRCKLTSQCTGIDCCMDINL